MTHTMLKLGVPKFKQRFKEKRVPFFASPCADIPRLTGANILRDPGFEAHLSLTPTGPDGEHFAGEHALGNGPPFNNLQWAAGTSQLVDPAVATVTPWGVFTNNGVGFGTSRWHISTANPRSGTYHARYEYDFEGPDSTLEPSELTPIGGRNCDGAAYSTQVTPGDVVSFSAYVYISDNTDNWFGEVYFTVWDANGDEVVEGTFGDTALSGGSYVQCSHNIVVPAGGLWVHAFLLPFVGGLTNVNALIDVDDCSLAVS